MSRSRSLGVTVVMGRRREDRAPDPFPIPARAAPHTSDLSTGLPYKVPFNKGFHGSKNFENTPLAMDHHTPESGMRR